MKKRNFVVALLAALIMMGIMYTPAFAVTESQVSLDTDSVTLTISASEEAHEFIRGRNASGNNSIK